MTDQQQAELVEHVIAGDWQCACCLDIKTGEPDIMLPDSSTCRKCWDVWVTEAGSRPWSTYVADIRRAKYGPRTSRHPIFTSLQR